MNHKFNTVGVAVAVAVLTALCALMPADPAQAAEEKYPAKPMRLIVSYGPGGATDLAARVLTGVIPEFLGQAVVVVNMPGAGGAVGFDAVRKAAPDGYTMMMTAIGSNVLVPAMNPPLPFKYDELVYVARTQINPNVLIVKKGSPWKDFKEFAADLKKNPGKFKYSTAGVGNVTHLGPVTLLKALKLSKDAAVPVHYDSDNGALLAVLQGEAHFAQGNLAPFASAIKGGAVIGLAMTTPKRVAGFEKIPTFTELGYPAVDILGWRGIAGPPKLPDRVVKVWEDALAKTCKSKSWIDLVKKLGDEPGYQGSKEYNAFVHKEFKNYREMFTELGLLIKKK